MSKYKGIKLHSQQKRIAEDIIQSPATHICINSGRQAGKSVLLIQLLMYYSINFTDNILIVAPFVNQAIKIFDDFIKLTAGSELVKKSNRTEKTIKLNNGAEIFFKSGENPDVIRSGSYRFIFMDEAAFIKKGVFEEHIEPTTIAQSKKGVKIFMFSTPRGKNDFYKYCMKGKSNDSYYAYYKMSTRGILLYLRNSSLRRNVSSPQLNLSKNMMESSLIQQVYLSTLTLL